MTSGANTGMTVYVNVTKGPTSRTAVKQIVGIAVGRIQSKVTLGIHPNRIRGTLIVQYQRGLNERSKQILQFSRGTMILLNPSVGPLKGGMTKPIPLRLGLKG